jgi:hypothetical protein
MIFLWIFATFYAILPYITPNEKILPTLMKGDLEWVIVSDILWEKTQKKTQDTRL